MNNTNGSSDSITSSPLCKRVNPLLDDPLYMSHSLSSDVLSLEPDLCSPDSVTLCIKLPNCDRVQRRFNYKIHCIKDVIHFACLSLNHGSIDFDEMCLSDSEMNVFSDYSQTLCQVGLTHNTVLHFSYR